MSLNSASVRYRGEVFTCMSHRSALEKCIARNGCNLDEDVLEFGYVTEAGFMAFGHRIQRDKEALRSLTPDCGSAGFLD